MTDKMTLIKNVARNLNDLKIDSVPTAATGTSVDCVKLLHQQLDAFLGKEFYIYSGAGAGQSRTVGSYVPASRRLVFAEIFGSVPSVNSNFVVFDYFNKLDYDTTFDTLYNVARLKYLANKVGTIQLSATQSEYPIPSGMEYIAKLHLIPSTNTDYEGDTETSLFFEFHSNEYRIEANPLGSVCIVFDPRKVNLDSFDKHWLRVVGQAKPDLVATDNGTILDDLESYLTWGMQMLLASRRMDEGSEWKSKFYTYRDMVQGRGDVNGLEEYVFRQPRGKACR